MSNGPVPRVMLLLFVTALTVVALVASGDGATDSVEARISVVGRLQMVFDWSREACSPVEEPDLPARAFRDDSGRTQLLVSHYESYRMIGSSLDSLHPECRPVFGSPGDPDPADFRDRRWIASPHTFDGRHVWALVHEEYQGNRHPHRCPEKAYYPCWYNTITLARSSDGGRSYRQARPPRQLVATSSRRYRHGIGPLGVFAPSNLVRRGDFFYALVRAREPGLPSGDCLMRSKDIRKPGSWRAWDGTSFRLAFRNPYRAPPKRRSRCERIAPGQISEMTESITFNLALHRYLLVGVAGPITSHPARERGVYYLLSEDLIHWTPRRLLFPVTTLHSYRRGKDSPIAYPSVLDPESHSRNFETSGRSPFLYFTKFRFRDCRKTSDRDLMRVRISVSGKG
jgi:hypothetical protein